MRATEVLVFGLDHPEGVCWDAERGCVWAGGEAGQVYRVELEERTFAEVARAPGLRARARGGRPRPARLCCQEAGVHAWDGERFTPIATDLTFANYPAFGPDGTLYVSDSGTWRRDDGRVLRIAADGERETLTRRAAVLHERARRLRPTAATSGSSSRPIRGSRGSSWRPAAARRSPAIDGAVLDGIAFTAAGGLLVSCYRPDRIYHLGARRDARGRRRRPAGDDPLRADQRLLRRPGARPRRLGESRPLAPDPARAGLRGVALHAARALGAGRRMSFVPRYYEIEQALRARIAVLDPGDVLPSDSALCEEFGVSRMTARQAVQVLTQEGLVERIRGRGTFVAEPSTHRQAGNLLSFTTEMRRQKRVPSSRLLERRS